MTEFSRAALRAFFEQNPREWAKVAPIHPGTVELITKLADNRAFSDARFLDFKSRKDAREQIAEADCMKEVLRLFRSEVEHARLQEMHDLAKSRPQPDQLSTGNAWKTP